MLTCCCVRDTYLPCVTSVQLVEEYYEMISDNNAYRNAAHNKNTRR